MKKVLEDPKLPYTQSATFEFPEGIDLCSKVYPGGVPAEGDSDPVSSTPEESIDGVFD